MNVDGKPHVLVASRVVVGVLKGRVYRALQIRAAQQELEFFAACSSFSKLAPGATQGLVSRQAQKLTALSNPDRGPHCEWVQQLGLHVPMVNRVSRPVAPIHRLLARRHCRIHRRILLWTRPRRLHPICHLDH